MALFIESKPIRTALRWQLYATAASMSLAAIWMGLHGALSALLGGLVTVTAGVAAAMLVPTGRRSAGFALMGLMRAEAARIALIVVQLWLVLAFYPQVVHAFFFGTFILTVIVFSFSIFAPSR